MVGCHAAADAAMSPPAPQPMKKPRAGSSHVDPPLRNGQSASPAVQSDTNAAPKTAASGRARPNALAAPPRCPFASPPNRPPSSATDAANTALLADHATAAAVAAPIRVAGAHGLASSQSGGRLPRGPGGRAGGLARAGAAWRRAGKAACKGGAIGEAAALAPAADAPAACLPATCAQQVYSHLTRSSTSRQRPDHVQTASRGRPISVQTASRQQNRSV